MAFDAFNYQDKVYLGKASKRKANRLLRSVGITQWCSLFGLRSDRSKVYAEQYGDRVHTLSVSRRKVLGVDIWKDLREFQAKEAMERRTMEDSLAIILQQDWFVKQLEQGKTA
jgi:hypothetical protein